MFFRIPNEFLLDIKIVEDLDIDSSEGYRCSEENENYFEEADEEYVNENI